MRPRTPRASGPKRILPRLLILAALLVLIWFVGGHQSPSGTSNQAAPVRRSTVIPGTASAHSTAPATALPPTDGTSTLGPSPIVNDLPPEQVAENFLAAYFTWDGPEQEADYIQTWAWMVAPDSLAALEKASPRHYLDNGEDVSAQSPTPSVPESAIHLQPQQSEIDVNWTVEVIPPGGELSTWAPRELHAQVTLAQQGAGWHVANVNWGQGSP